MFTFGYFPGLKKLKTTYARFSETFSFGMEKNKNNSGIYTKWREP
jgi:hypothetical protein